MDAIIIFAVFVAVLVVCLLASKKRKAEYDERQLYYRGKAYRISMIATILSCVFSSLLLLFNEKFQPYGMFLLLSSAFLGITLFAIVTIWNDAFHSTTSNPKAYLILVGVVVLLNGGTTFISPEWSGFYELVTTYHCFNFVLFLCFSAVFLTFLLKMVVSKKEE